jgi:putative phage-type endonuclease
METAREQFVNGRRRGLGGSDLASILGLSPWKTAYQVWREKTQPIEDTEPNAAMQYGNLIEPVIRQWYADETGRKVTVLKDMLHHPQYPFIIANLDGIADGQRVLEIKTAQYADDWGEPGTDEIPLPYSCQVQQYMMVTGFNVADVAVSFGGRMPVIYEVPADKDLHTILLEKMVEFWALVQSNTPPEPVTYADAIARFGGKSVGKVVVASEFIEDRVKALREIRQQCSTLEEQEKRLKADLMIELGENDTLVDPSGKVLATWKQSKATTKFDSDLFKLENPTIFSAYQKEQPGSRRFLIKN